MLQPLRHDAIERVLAAAAEAGSLREIGESALPPLRDAVGAATSLLYRYDAQGRLEGLFGELATVLGEYSSHHWRVDPVQAHPRRLAPQPRVVLATREVDRQVHRRSVAYDEFYAPFELEHLACVWLTDRPYGAPGMTGLLLTRPASRDDFGDDEQGLLGHALPALAAAVARVDRLARLERERRALEALVTAGPPRLVLSLDGDVIWASRTASALLDAAAVAGLARAARRLRAALRAGAPPMPTVVPIGEASGPRASLSLLRDGDGWMVHAEIEGAAEGGLDLEELARRFQLTRAESAVLRELAQGRANGDIAARLYVSIETVRTHVRRVLGKLGVRSRTEAALLASRGLRRVG